MYILIGASIGMQLIELQDSNAELQKQLDAKQDNEQRLHKQLKAFVDELQEKKNEKLITEGKLKVMKEQYQQQLKEKDLQLTQSKEKGEALWFELKKKQEEFAKEEKELSRELHQLNHSKKEELAKTENEFKHQLQEKEQKLQEYSHLLQECLDALHAQKQKNESQNIQLLHHSPQGMYCI